ncbi:hypothetical protein BGZ60DRAFT_527019 [Tricladium varicosporioides]|nr:hypothetical protein BGZ60DRAFT_527019 [Hymenoscyphus varicosporioides]
MAERHPERLAMFTFTVNDILVMSGVYIGTINRIGWGYTGSTVAEMLQGSTRLFTYAFQPDRNHEPDANEKSTEFKDLDESRTLLNTNWGPFWVAIGDIVIVAAACCVPLILRRQSDCFLLVGGCVLIDSPLQNNNIKDLATDPGISPIMHGSAWDETKLEKYCIRCVLSGPPSYGGSSKFKRLSWA